MILKIMRRIIYITSSFEKRANLLRKKGAIIWNNCEIYRDVDFWSEPWLIEIGNNVRITNQVRLTTHDWGMRVLTNMWKIPDNSGKFWRIKIGNNVHIWVRSIIMPGVTIWDNVIIWAWSIITKDIPSNSVAVWVPCKVIETVEEYYEKNRDKILFFEDTDSQEIRKIQNKISF